VTIGRFLRYIHITNTAIDYRKIKKYTQSKACTCCHFY